MGTKITFQRPDGKQAAGYLAKAGRAKAPGVVVIQEWWGLQDQIKGICDRFALAGYEALAPDLYAGTVVPYHDTAAAGREMNSLNFLEATDQVVRGAAQLLKRTGVKVGLTGFCLGGAVTILGACPRAGVQRRGLLLRAAAGDGRQAGRHQGAAAGALRQPRRLVHAGGRRHVRGGSQGGRQEAPRSSATTPTTASSTSSATPTTARRPSWPGSGRWRSGDASGTGDAMPARTTS